MTDAMMSLCGVMEKSADDHLLREMIGLPQRFLIRLTVASQCVTLRSSFDASQVLFAEQGTTSAKPERSPRRRDRWKVLVAEGRRALEHHVVAEPGARNIRATRGD